MKIGSTEHKELFCKTFLDSHRQFEPEQLPWPEMDEKSLQRLLSIPFWGEAIRIEQRAGLMVSAFAETIQDPVIQEAIALQGVEEARHGRLIKHMTDRYHLQPIVHPLAPIPADIKPAFIKFGYGECIDSFFAFGLFELGRQSGFFPESLLTIFDHVLDEEARHISFFVNWIAYDQVEQGLGTQPIPAALTLWNYGRALLNLVNLIRSAASTGSGSGFTATGGNVIDVDLTPEKFLSTCLVENTRRMSKFDDRLLRPQLLPSLGQSALNVLNLIPGRRHSTSPELSL
ncbi:hypothetical protein BST81_23115 [Leptolyngbya sp. 'hensonii']|uniref:ferritin-like domain-containing protein n=1 Tax=Leptolyngbya sp. 'hensonii' TaxID=1922337 RepID=UPI00094FD934|nr:ferritin-like domain-containing protein [Leptolyngbya sp. 'hensonii']OLP16117.1 hypothetical protein BST81_23115 [Leptolyngbya sp. 'hensonii']